MRQTERDEARNQAKSEAQEKDVLGILKQTYSQESRYAVDEKVTLMFQEDKKFFQILNGGTRLNSIWL